MRQTSGEEAVMEESAWTRYETRAAELLTAMNNQEVKPDMSNEEAKPEKKRSYKILLQNILMTCCCLLAIAAVGKGFLHLDNGISTVGSAVGSAVKDLNTLKAQMTAADTKEQLAAVTAEMKDLKATNTQLQAEVEQIR
jgi:cell division protein FtsB